MAVVQDAWSIEPFVPSWAPPGTQVQCSVLLTNLLGKTLEIHVVWEDVKEVLGFVPHYYDWFPPGGKRVWYLFFTQPEEGIKLTLKAYALDPLTAERHGEWEKSYFIGTTGGILLEPQYWNEKAKEYQDIPPTVNPGETIGLRVYAKNETTQTESYYPYLQTNVGPLIGTIKEVGPGLTVSWEIQWSAPTVGGDVLATVLLYRSDNMLLDTWTGRVATVKEVVKYVFTIGPPVVTRI